VAVVQFPTIQKVAEAVVDVMNTGVGIRTFFFLHILHCKAEIGYFVECVELVDDMFMSATKYIYDETGMLESQRHKI
jgi:hypothetical protein